MTRPPSVDKHLADLHRFFADGDPPGWEFANGTDFHAERAVKSLKRYIRRLERGLEAKEAA